MTLIGGLMVFGLIERTLQLTRSTVKDVMVPIDQVFMVRANDVCDDKLIKNVVAAGFSRIPVFEDNRGDIIGILLLRDLVTVALDWTPESPPQLVRSVMRASKGVVFFTNTTIGDAFGEFKIGRSHLALVRRMPSREHAGGIAGIVTINDVMELIVQSKILGEENRYEAALNHRSHPSAPTSFENTPLLSASSA